MREQHPPSRNNGTLPRFLEGTYSFSHHNRFDTATLPPCFTTLPHSLFRRGRPARCRVRKVNRDGSDVRTCSHEIVGSGERNFATWQQQTLTEHRANMVNRHRFTALDAQLRQTLHDTQPASFRKQQLEPFCGPAHCRFRLQETTDGITN
jgi:hypothetical protein